MRALLREEEEEWRARLRAVHPFMKRASVTRPLRFRYPIRYASVTLNPKP